MPAQQRSCGDGRHPDSIQGIETVRSPDQPRDADRQPRQKPSAGVNPVRQPEQRSGARAIGAFPDTYPGYQYVKFRKTAKFVSGA
ncbi:hypothetical protein KCP76_11715 [Salmonella enterica subsp. enterica serovar Weltevreden]|nr:hypothetical protein KCP76_11715 [Salmonella enterica subsp. enterica serovar Weltevreden]